MFGMNPVSCTCRRFCLTWLGHVIREGKKAASCEALSLAVHVRDT